MGEPLTNEDGKLKAFGKLKSILGKNGLLDLGFDVPSGKLTPRKCVILNRVEEEMPYLFWHQGGGVENDPHQGFSPVMFARGMISKRNFG